MAGTDVVAEMFRICRACGKLDRDAGVSSHHEHRPWCPHRMDPDEHTRLLALSRELITQGVALSLPDAISAELHSNDSLAAAVKLGLQEAMGGAPDHLQVAVVPQPAGGQSGQVRTALFLHDTVPGGTGYLTELADPARLWAILVRAARVLEDCPCQDEGRASCHWCLLPLVASPDHSHRIDALQALKRLLGLADDAAVADVEVDLPLWDVSAAAVDPGSGESPLEQRFRSVMAEQLGQVASVQSRPGVGGKELVIRATDDRVWRLRPQVDAHGSRPDFLLETQGLPPTAIFVDGWSFHASPHNNRLGDDAEKRQRLRDHGYQVVSVTHADLDDAVAPPWLNDVMIGMLMQQQAGQLGAGVSREAAEEHKKGPLGLLGGLVQRPDDPARTRLGNAAGLLLAVQSGRGGRCRVPVTESLLAAAADMLAGEKPSASEGDEVLTYSMPHMVFLARMRSSQPQEMVLVLDDRDEAVEAPDHADSWREWLRLSNLIDQGDVPAQITTRTRIDEAGGATSAPAVKERRSWPGVDLSDLDDEVAELAQVLAERGLASADVGQELDGGIVAELSWSEQRVAVVYDEMPEDEVAELATAGWRVLRADAEVLSVADAVMGAMSENGEE